MFKKISLFLLSAFCFLLFGDLAIAASSTPSATATPSARAQEILQRVLAKSAETPRHTFLGKIKTLGTSSIVIASPDGDKTISTTNATSFYRYRSGNRTETNFSNLKVGDDLVAIGAVDPASNQMTAFQIVAKVHRYNLIGIIESANNGIISLKEFGGSVSQIDLNDAVTLKKNVGTIFSTAKLPDFKPGVVAAVICYTNPTTSTLSSLRATVVNY
jgi:hypothetical protein